MNDKNKDKKKRTSLLVRDKKIKDKDKDNQNVRNACLRNKIKRMVVKKKFGKSEKKKKVQKN